MEIMIIDCNLNTHDTITEGIKAAFPEALIYDFTDPLLALKHGINSRTDLLIIQPVMRFAIADDIMVTLRKHYSDMKVLFVSDMPMRRTSDFRERPDAVIQMPVTREKVVNALNV